jgi:hypothetical protein
VRSFVGRREDERPGPPLSFRGGRRTKIRYDFIWERGRWAIDDVRFVIEPNPWSLRAVLTQYFAALVG